MSTTNEDPSLSVTEMEYMIPKEKEQWYDEAARQKRAERALKKATVRREEQHSAPPLRPNPRYFSMWDLMTSSPSGGTLRWLPVKKFRPDEWYSESDLYANEVWKERVANIIEERIACFERTSPRVSIARCETRRDEVQRNTLTTTLAFQQVFGTTELLDAVLQFASPETQLKAYNVNRKWRAVVERIIKCYDQAENFSGAQSADVVGYGDSVIFTQSQIHVTNEELDEMEVALAIAQERVYDLDAPDEYVYFPAKLTQAVNVSDELSEKVQIFQENQYDAIASGEKTRMQHLRQANAPYEIFQSNFGTPSGFDQPGPHQPRWLDFSQFAINPYLKGLFGARLSTSLGRYEVILQGGSSRDLVVDRKAVPESLLELLQSMFVTQPPCKTVGLFTWEPKWQADGHAHLKFLRKVHDDRGIRIGTLLRAMQEQSSVVVSQWICHAQKLQEWVNAGHWKYDVWIVPGAPKIAILLSNEEILDAPPIDPLEEVEDAVVDHTNVAQWLQTVNRESRLVRQSEWMNTEMMKPPRPQSAYADVLPGIYSVGFSGSLFENHEVNYAKDNNRLKEYGTVLELIRRRWDMLWWLDSNDTWPADAWAGVLTGKFPEPFQQALI